MNSHKIFCLILTAAFLLIGCSKDEVVDSVDTDSEISQEETSSKALKQIGSGVMMQAFYWDVPAGGT